MQPHGPRLFLPLWLAVPSAWLPGCAKEKCEGRQCFGAEGEDADADTDADGGVASWQGTATYLFGAGMTPEEMLCVLKWDNTGEPSSRGQCDDCLWGFDVHFTYDAAASDNTGRCQDESEADWTWSLSWDPTYHDDAGPQWGSLWYYSEYDGAWIPQFTAYTADYPGTGATSYTIVWTHGTYADPYEYDGYTYYSTDYWKGYAYVE